MPSKSSGLQGRRCFRWRPNLSMASKSSKLRGLRCGWTHETGSTLPRSGASAGRSDVAGDPTDAAPIVPVMPTSTAPASSDLFVFRAAIVGWRGVSRKLAVRSDQTLVDLHRLLQTAFEWDDDHLYAFWVSGRVWDREPGVGFGRPARGLADGSCDL